MNAQHGFWSVITFTTILLILASTASAQSTNETAAKLWLNDFDKQVALILNEDVIASWAYNTNLTKWNSKKSIEASLRTSAFRKGKRAEAMKLFKWKEFKNENIKRLFMKLTDIGTAAMSDVAKLKKLSETSAGMEEIYSTAKFIDDQGKVNSLDPELTHLFATSQDPLALKAAWKGWRDVSGKKMRSAYTEFVALHNEGIRDNGYNNTADYWQSWYEYSSNEEFESEMARLFDEIKEFYQHLHYYVKQKLIKKYGAEHFPKTGQIPAHLLGNMWAQSWGQVTNITRPFEGQASIDVTPEMVAQNYKALDMFELSDSFFTSLGLKPMTPEFWRNSLIEKPMDREVVCHASAWDFYNKNDFRVKQCTVVTMDDLITVHHEMGHIQYYQQYKDQPVLFRRGANPGFHEAVGDLLALSVSTPRHLKEIKLLKEMSNSTEYDINFLFTMASDKMGFLPFGYLIDKWRWDVFNGKIKSSEYNEKWWDLRCSIQGVAAPVKRSEDDFDPGAKYHIPGNTPYIRYFVSHILQFQFHEALCKEANHTGPLHTCDIYKSKAAGTKLENGLKLGSSQHWKVAMKAITGQEKISAESINKYFAPLIEFLKKENGDANIAWDNSCPGADFYPADKAATVNSLSPFMLFSVMAALAMYSYNQ